jgi:uncharacterized membrane protein
MPELMRPAGDPVDLRMLSFIAVAIGVLAQIVYVLVDGRQRVWMTILSVLAFFAAAALHAASESLLALCSLLVGCVVLGFVAEYIGVRTGIPFGKYEYAQGTWLKIAGVPIVVPLAWAMIGWPAFVAGRMAGQPMLGAPILAAWDLFLDPQMVKDGRWMWADSDWPKINGVPVSNVVGWLIVSAIMMFLLDRGVNHVIDFEGIPLLVLAWTWISSIVAHLVFLDLRGSGLVGGIFMSAAMVPVVLRFLATQRSRSAGSPAQPPRGGPR